MSNHHGNSGPNQDGGKDQKRKVSGDLHVRGEIVVDSPPEVKDAAATEKKESSTRENLKVRIEVFTLFFVIIYAGLTFWQACSNQTIAKLTRKQFLADERPYVATTPTKINSVSVVGGRLATAVSFWNYGKSPALRLKETGRIFLNDGSFEQSNKWFKVNLGNRPLDQADLEGDQLNESIIMQGQPDSKVIVSREEAPQGFAGQFVVAMRYEYFDDAGNRYWTDECFYAMPGQPAATIRCPHHNEIR
jgi:hypothetical protein